MLVTIVAVPNADNTGLDIERLEKVEDLPDEVGRQMLDIGTAREPSDGELDAYHAKQAAATATRPPKKAGGAPVASPVVDNAAA